MSGRAKFIATLSIIFILYFGAQVALFFSQDSVIRSDKELLNQFYALQTKQPAAAQKALQILVERHPNDINLRTELAYFLLHHQQHPAALKEFQTILAQDPSNKNATYQVSLLQPQQQMKEYSSEKLALISVAKPTILTSTPVGVSPFGSLLRDAFSGAYRRSFKAAPTTSVQTQTKIPLYDQLLNKFYDAKKAHASAKAWQAMAELLRHFPNDVRALKEAGYYALSEHNNLRALPYFVHAYDVSHDPKLALQTGYILDGLNQKKAAYHYFQLATKTTNLDDQYKAQIAVTNLFWTQIKIIPSPYFAEFYATPFYYSRFKLLVYPLIFRVGRVLNEKYNFQVYLSYRRTSDDKSGVAGIISNIYEDNAAITDAGFSFTPFPSVALMYFMEAGKSVDLVYRNRSRWRNDFRTGLTYFNAWGYVADYTFKPTFRAKFKADVYADAIYYSRYTDTIATVRGRPGLEIFRYQTSSILLYAKGFLTQDTQRDFYNNAFEYGPGIALLPSDRYNIALRYENLNGHYLPCGGKYKNPYSINYHNNVTELDIFFRF